ncbi:MAG: hypothetical protein JRG91_15910 [Deltaproteobacteria bacterium]|nr:hypothetical protein [Deltaproteobacteria bacterium]
MKAVDHALLERFVQLAGQRLSGDWVVMGGGVLPLLGIEHRVTVDVDIAGPESAGQEQTLALMHIAEELGLPVEAINQAGAFFLHRIEGWREELVTVHEGPGATIHRPNVTLFMLLKIPRLSEADLSDCLEMLRWASRGGEEPDTRRILSAIERALDDCASQPRHVRLESLADALA